MFIIKKTAHSAVYGERKTKRKTAQTIFGILNHSDDKNGLSFSLSAAVVHSSIFFFVINCLKSAFKTASRLFAAVTGSDIMFMAA